MLETMLVVSISLLALNPSISMVYGGWESSMRSNFRKHMQIEKAPANQENFFINLTAGAANAHNTQIKKRTR